MLRNALLALALICTSAVPAFADDELLRALGDAKPADYAFATSDDEEQATASLTYRGLRERVTMSGTKLILKVARVTDKKSGVARIYRTEILRVKDAVTLRISDVDTGEVILDRLAPPPVHGGGGDFDECFRNFECNLRGPLQCEADRTCEPQVVAVTCCDDQGNCISVHFIVRPQAVRCALRDLVPNLDNGVLVQN